MKRQHKNKNGNDDNTKDMVQQFNISKAVFCSAPKCVDNKKVENNYRSTFCDCFRAPK